MFTEVVSSRAVSLQFPQITTVNKKDELPKREGFFSQHWAHTHFHEKLYYTLSHSHMHMQELVYIFVCEYTVCD